MNEACDPGGPAVQAARLGGGPKWLLAIAHYGVLFFLDIAAFVVVIAAWSAIVISRRYPPGLCGFEGAICWNARVTGHTLTLVTDRYPRFRLAT